MTFDVPTELLTFKVPGRAVPWKAPKVVRNKGKSHTYTDSQTFLAWKEWVAFHAGVAWGRRYRHAKPYNGIVGMNLWFYVHPPIRRGVVTADVTNLTKAAEDACKGVVIKDDRQVFASHCERYFIDETEEQRMWVQFWKMPCGRIEPEEPGPFAFRPWEWWNNED